jgi:hypothetical protein
MFIKAGSTSSEKHWVRKERKKRKGKQKPCHCEQPLLRIHAPAARAYPCASQRSNPALLTLDNVPAEEAYNPGSW